jgi:hypothetical protein
MTTLPSAVVSYAYFFKRVLTVPVLSMPSTSSARYIAGFIDAWLMLTPGTVGGSRLSFKLRMPLQLPLTQLALS